MLWVVFVFEEIMEVFCLIIWFIKEFFLVLGGFNRVIWILFCRSLFFWLLSLCMLIECKMFFISCLILVSSLVGDLLKC